MPKTNIDYSKCIIYKIVCKDLNIKDCYVGHTTNFIKRKCAHKYYCNNDKSKAYNVYLYQYIRENGGWENWDMIEIEKYNCIDVYEAVKRERYFVEILNATLNCQIPSRTIKEYYEDNKEKKREYYEDNKEEILQQRKEYYENNKETHKEKLREYRENNKEKIQDYNKEWYENNKETHKEKIKEYNEKNKEKIKEWCKEWRKEYNEKNKEKIREYQREYREKNKEKKKEYKYI